MQTTALIIFVITYIGIIFTRLPKANIDRPSAAFFGAVAMILFGVLSFEEAIDAVDFDTIALLLGMMIVIATLQLDGFFSFIASKTIAYAANQWRLLIIITFFTGIASAFLVNDAVVLLFTPVIIMICRNSKLNPVPYLIAEILAANAGSVMAITGNPQNMLIGVNSGIGYAEFLWKLAPVSLLSMLIIVWVVRWVYPTTFRNKQPIIFQNQGFEYHFASMKYSVPVFLLVILLFFLGSNLNLSIPMIALIGGSLILLLGKIKPSRVIEKVDWVLLLFFASLFIVVEGLEKSGLLIRYIDANLFSDDLMGIGAIHGISLALVQVVSNVPFTVVMLPFMKAAASELLWLTLASASTLAGNATIIGAIANLIVIEVAEREGIKIGFFEFLKPGIIVTILSFVISIAVLYLYTCF
ncbi:MAG: anion transporter [Bacteroidales bacterium]|nr:anion transporter [Bacteroidales bacterium]